ncbi:putative LRR receptor-like serine/threonine-protein kinase [Prunus yedoensis var. nudiflora]|uniref:Putative LRR receptor-like serine/threonine-protein kinase n=1 Tax=Prunus yedoensis var. nudiflora TaxID=2094558 RepID=A0A314YFQ9_PRUYE|nr:putative LRR receptor-like serine/threonine-protein kinase [Prunus yedoensis var. nudiflora]
MNFDIAKEAKGPDEPQTRHFEADVNDSVLEISFYWAGKGCADDLPTLNGPLISAISITPGSKSRLKFNWETRFNICLGIARGLDHLHEHPRLKMVHRDIKAENILLDGALNAKISDFGMASLYTEEEQLMIIKVEAPNGHMAPEYVVQGFVTSKVDVYSFGVVIILEIVSGKKNAGYKFNHESEYLLDMAYVANKNGSLMDLVDKNLSDIYDAKQAITILTLAVMCTNISPTLRPRMADVVSVLVGEKTFEQINPPTVDDHQLNVAMARGECTKADSSTSTDVTSRASTSTKLIKGIDETQNSSAETCLEISEESLTSH